MFNFDFIKSEELIEVFENIWISQGKNEKNTTIALTNKRLLFMDYDKFDPKETLRLSQVTDYDRYKQVYYQVDLDNLESLTTNDCYLANFKNDFSFKFDDIKLYELLSKTIKK